MAELRAKPVVDATLKEIKKQVEEIKVQDGKILCLAIICNPEDPASKVYVGNKVKKCKECGIDVEVFEYGRGKDTQEYLDLIKKLNSDPKYTGIIVQLPLPKSKNDIDRQKIIQAIEPLKDVDGFVVDNKEPSKELVKQLDIIKQLKGKDWLNGKNIGIVNLGNAGRQLAQLLVNEDATVTIYNKTSDIFKNTDIIFCKDSEKSKIDEKNCKLIIGVNEKSLGDIKGFLNEPQFVPCTPYGILKLLKYYKGQDCILDKNVVVIGRSDIVGKPIARECVKCGARSVTICHSKTKDLMAYTNQADIIICATGNVNTITADMVKDGAVVIDVGINKKIDNNPDGKKICGDCDFDGLKDKCDITPVPGGIGPMTVISLVSRLTTLYELQKAETRNILDAIRKPNGVKREGRTPMSYDRN